jgi:hypothetical protein
MGSCGCKGKNYANCGCSPSGFPNCACGKVTMSTHQRDNLNRLIGYLKPDTSVGARKLLDNVIQYRQLVTDNKENDVSQILKTITASVESLNALEKASYKNFISTLTVEDK